MISYFVASRTAISASNHVVKNAAFVTLWLLFLAISSRATNGQGTMLFNNLGPKNGKVIVTGPEFSVPLQQDLNFELRVYSLGGSSVIYQRSWLLSDGTARGINAGPGLFADPSHSVIVLPGVFSGDSRSVIIRGWAGNYNTFFEAEDAGAASGQTSGYIVAGTLELPPKSLEFTESLIITVPEPGTITLAVMEFFLLFLNRIENSSNRQRTEGRSGV